MLSLSWQLPLKDWIALKGPLFWKQFNYSNSFRDDILLACKTKATKS